MGQIDVAETAGPIDDAVEVDAVSVSGPGRVGVHIVFGVPRFTFCAYEHAVVATLDFVEQYGVRARFRPIKHVSCEILPVRADRAVDADGVFPPADILDCRRRDESSRLEQRGFRSD